MKNGPPVKELGRNEWMIWIEILMYAIASEVCILGNKIV
jgi:hypothetical protein